MKQVQGLSNYRMLAALIMLACLASTAQGSIIAQYNFTNTPGNQSAQLPSSVDPLYSFYDIQRMTGLQKGPALPNSINSTIDYTQDSEWRYYTLWGYTNDYSPWTFNYVRSGYMISTQTGTLPTQATLEYSLDSGTTFTSLGTLNLTSTTGDLNFTFPTVNVPVDTYFGSSFKITVLGGSGTDTTFALTNGSYGGLEVGNTTAVPEPSTYALLCISLGVVGYAKRKMGQREAQG